MTENTANPESSATDGEIPEPHLGVYVLTEFCFCPRAGLCTLETGHEEEEVPPRSFFQFNPLYTLAEIEAALQKAVSELTWFMAGAALTAVIAAMLSAFVDRTVGLVAAVGIVWFLVFSTIRAVRVAQLLGQRRKALAGKFREPDPQSSEVQPVHWWDLIRAGFETQPAHDRLIDPELNFSGKPDRFLRRENTVIPVWRMPHYRESLYPQNFLRMAAYCHLIEKSLGGGVECPYGVILFGYELDGVAIPVDADLKSGLFKSLRMAREVIADKRKPPQPPEESLCLGCPHGKPRVHIPNETEHICKGKSLPVIAATSAMNGRGYHSLCGDRFRWMPPHLDVAAKDLRSPV